MKKVKTRQQIKACETKDFKGIINTSKRDRERKVNLNTPVELGMFENGERNEGLNRLCTPTEQEMIG